MLRNLNRFERPGGLQTSDFEAAISGTAPFGWAPLQWMAVQGLRRFGYQSDADRIAKRFLSMVLREYERHGSLEEKYDVVRRTDDVAGGLRYGYDTNEAGFGWDERSLHRPVRPATGQRAARIAEGEGLKDFVVAAGESHAVEASHNAISITTELRFPESGYRSGGLRGGLAGYASGAIHPVRRDCAQFTFGVSSTIPSPSSNVHVAL